MLATWWLGKAGFREAQGCLEGAQWAQRTPVGLGILEVGRLILHRVRGLKGWVAAGVEVM